MATQKSTKGIIAILTGGGDVPGLNPAIRAVTIRANREGYKVIGLRRGWAGISELIRDHKADNSNNFQILTDDIVNKAGRTGGTFLHTSRTRQVRIYLTYCAEVVQLADTSVSEADAVRLESSNLSFRIIPKILREILLPEV